MPESLNGLVWVALGSAFGGMARLFLSGFVAQRIGNRFPWGTVIVNITGAFALGVIAAAADRHVHFPMPEFWQFSVVGIIGSYTTVSSFSLQTLDLARNGERFAAGANVAISVVACLVAVALGFSIGAAAIG